MNFRLVDAGWDKVLDDALRADSSRVRIVCPFIKRRTAERLLKRGKPKALQVITRFNLDEFCEGVSDIAALRLLLENGAQIRGVRNLHAKLYLFGASRIPFGRFAVATAVGMVPGTILYAVLGSLAKDLAEVVAAGAWTGPMLAYVAAGAAITIGLLVYLALLVRRQLAAVTRKSEPPGTSAP